MSFKPVYNISAKSASEVDILIYGVIGDSYWGDSNPGKKFVSDFNGLEKKYDRINIRINSPGGSVWDGLAIFNAIKSSKKETHTYIDGIAYSMGAMIALAGKTVHAAKGSLFLLHNVLGGAIGNARDMRKTADDMDLYDEVLGQLIADKTGKSLDDVKKEWMNYEDNLMTSTKAFDNKLVDVIETYDAKDVPDNIEDMTIADVMAFYQPATDTAEPGFIEKLAAKVGSIINTVTPQKPENMSFKKLTALKGKEATALTQADIDPVNTEIAEFEIEGCTLVLDAQLAQYTAAVAQVTELEASIETYQDQVILKDAEISALKAKLAAPAAEITRATSIGDVIQGTTGEANKFMTSIDHEKAALKAQWGE